MIILHTLEHLSIHIESIIVSLIIIAHRIPNNIYVCQTIETSNVYSVKHTKTIVLQNTSPICQFDFCINLCRLDKVTNYRLNFVFFDEEDEEKTHLKYIYYFVYGIFELMLDVAPIDCVVNLQILTLMRSYTFFFYNRFSLF